MHAVHPLAFNPSSVETAVAAAKSRQTGRHIVEPFERRKSTRIRHQRAFRTWLDAEGRPSVFVMRRYVDPIGRGMIEVLPRNITATLTLCLIIITNCARVQAGGVAGGATAVAVVVQRPVDARLPHDAISVRTATPSGTIDDKAADSVSTTPLASTPLTTSALSALSLLQRSLLRNPPALMDTMTTMTSTTITTTLPPTLDVPAADDRQPANQPYLQLQVQQQPQQQQQHAQQKKPPASGVSADEDYYFDTDDDDDDSEYRTLIANKSGEFFFDKVNRESRCKLLMNHYNMTHK